MTESEFLDKIHSEIAEILGLLESPLVYTDSQEKGYKLLLKTYGLIRGRLSTFKEEE